MFGFSPLCFDVPPPPPSWILDPPLVLLFEAEQSYSRIINTTHNRTSACRFKKPFPILISKFESYHWVTSWKIWRLFRMWCNQLTLHVGKMINATQVWQANPTRKLCSVNDHCLKAGIVVVSVVSIKLLAWFIRSRVINTLSKYQTLGHIYTFGPLNQLVYAIVQCWLFAVFAWIRLSYVGGIN